MHQLETRGPPGARQCRDHNYSGSRMGINGTVPGCLPEKMDVLPDPKRVRLVLQPGNSKAMLWLPVGHHRPIGTSCFPLFQGMIQVHLLVITPRVFLYSHMASFYSARFHPLSSCGQCRSILNSQDRWAQGMKDEHLVLIRLANCQFTVLGGGLCSSFRVCWLTINRIFNPAILHRQNVVEPNRWSTDRDHWLHLLDWLEGSILTCM